MKSASTSADGLWRFYDPSTGRYLTPDPLATRIPTHRDPPFTYAFSNPLRFTDPFGLYGTDDCSYYNQRCMESGGAYYCEQAPKWCKKFPAPPDPDPKKDDDYEGWSRCTRQCLQDCDRAENKDQNKCPQDADDRKGPWDPRSTSFECHQICYRGCFFNRFKRNPFE